MADAKITALTANTTPALSDVTVMVDDPGGTPATQKITLANLISLAYPISSIFISVSSTNPGTSLGFGTWVAFGTGRMLVGIDTGDTSFDVVEETGGAKTVTIAQANLPNISTGAGTAHAHVQTQGTGATGNFSTAPIDNSSGGTGGTVAVTTAANSTATENAHTHSLGGSGTALSVMNPYIVVYMWKRTA